MKYIITLLIALTGLFANSQTMIYSETDGENGWVIIYTEDFGLTRDTLALWTKDYAHLFSDSLIFDAPLPQNYVVDSTTFSGLAATVSYPVTHGLDFTPSQIHIQPMNQDAAEWCWVHSINSTTFTITFVVNPTTGTNNIKFGYIAYR